jgi:hypothetical protein
MRELQRRRQTSAVFAGKDGFITARDLLRCVTLFWVQPPSLSALLWRGGVSDDEQHR